MKLLHFKYTSAQCSKRFWLLIETKPRRGGEMCGEKQPGVEKFWIYPRRGRVGKKKVKIFLAGEGLARQNLVFRPEEFSPKAVLGNKTPGLSRDVNNSWLSRDSNLAAGWEARMLPLCYTRFNTSVCKCWFQKANWKLLSPEACIPSILKFSEGHHSWLEEVFTANEYRENTTDQLDKVPSIWWVRLHQCS